MHLPVRDFNPVKSVSLWSHISETQFNTNTNKTKFMKTGSNISKTCLWAIFGILLLQTPSAPALVVGWYPGMYLNVGDGVDPDQLNQPVAPGAVITSPNGTYLNTGYQSEIITFAQNTYDLVNTLSVNASVSLDYLVGGADVSTSFFGSQTFDANDVHFVFTKTRNFGTTNYTPICFAPSYQDLIASNQLDWQGEALHSENTRGLGTYYVSGIQKAAMISVLYTFHFASSSVKQQFTLSASGSSSGLFTSASFSAYVNSFFESTNSSTSMTYVFYSTDPNQSTTNLHNSASGSITSFQQFTNFVNQLEAYGNAMDPAQAKVTAYDLNPIQTVPGYFFLLGGYVPPPVEPADCNDFLESLTALENWQQRLESRGPMSWLNAKGQQVLSNNVVDVNNFVSNMQAIAANHFSSNAPLVVPPSVVAYLANLSDLRLPEIYAMDSWNWYEFYPPDNEDVYLHTLIGRVDCGNSDLVAPIPFANVSITNGGSPTTVTLYYSPSDFEKAMTNAYASGTINTHLKALFASEQWYHLTNSNPDTNAYFLITEGENAANSQGLAAKWSAAIFDPFTGEALDEMDLLDTRSGGCPNPSEFSDGVSVAVVGTSPPANGVVGLTQPVTLQITNQSSAQAYGTTVSFVLNDAFDFGGASGSQGYASFDPSSRTVSYAVGPMTGNSSANISLNLIPLQPTATIPGSQPVVGVSNNLSNSVPITVSFAPIASALPAIGLSRTPGGLQLDWWSDTDRLLAEQSPSLGSGESWSPITSGTSVTSASHRFLALPISGGQGYFRLQSQ